MSRPAPDWALLARRVLIGTAVLTGVLVVIGMVLSYAGLRSFFAGAGYTDWQSAAAPFVVDLLALVGYVGLLVLRSKAYPGAVVAATVVASAGAQGYHLSHGGISAVLQDGRVIAAAGAAPFICVGLAGHLLWLIIARALPAAFITALQEQAAPELPQSYERPQPYEHDLSRPWQPPDPWAPELPAARTFAAEMQTAEPEPETDSLSVAYAKAELERMLGWENLPNPQVHEAGETFLEATGTRPARLHSVPVPRPRAAGHRRQRRPAVTPRTDGKTIYPSQAIAPCAPNCKHHVGDVSKSTRYRCQPGGACRTCNPEGA